MLPAIGRFPLPGGRLVPADEGGGFGVMFCAVVPDGIEASGGIAVRAVERAGIIHADVLAENAAAELSLAWIFPGADIDPEYFLDQSVVDAFSGGYPVGLEINVLRATLDPHPVLRCYFCDAADQTGQRIGSHVLQREAFFFQAANARGDRFVDVNQADDDTLSVPLERGCDLTERLQVERDGSLGTQDDRVVAPDHLLGPYLLGKRLERCQGGCSGWTVGVQQWWVPQNGVLEVKAVAAFKKFGKILCQRFRIARPEYDDIDVLRPEGDSGDLLRVERIGSGTIAGTDTVHKPFRVERRDIRSSTGTDYHFDLTCPY